MKKYDADSLWCIVKKAPIRSYPGNNGEIIAWLRFGQKVLKTRKPITNGFVKVECRFNDGSEAKKYFTGWVSLKAFTTKEFEDYGLLWFENQTMNRLPAKSSYNGGELIGYIDPGESVVVSAKVGNLCLTNRGWTRFNWLTKSRYIFDQSVIDNVLYAALAWAVRDYKSTVKRILKHKYETMKDYCNLVDDLDEIGVFFLDKGNAMNIDKVPGEERFAMINSELGIDNEWIKEQLWKRDSFRQLKKSKRKT